MWILSVNLRPCTNASVDVQVQPDNPWPTHPLAASTVWARNDPAGSTSDRKTYWTRARWETLPPHLAGSGDSCGSWSPEIKLLLLIMIIIIIIMIIILVVFKGRLDCFTYSSVSNYSRRIKLIRKYKCVSELIRNWQSIAQIDFVKIFSRWWWLVSRHVTDTLHEYTAMQLPTSSFSQVESARVWISARRTDRRRWSDKTSSRGLGTSARSIFASISSVNSTGKIMFNFTSSFSSLPALYSGILL